MHVHTIVVSYMNQCNFCLCSFFQSPLMPYIQPGTLLGMPPSQSNPSKWFCTCEKCRRYSPGGKVIPESVELEANHQSYRSPAITHNVRKLDLSHLCFSLNFYFPYVSLQFPSMFSLLTYFHSFFSLSADYPRHSRQRRSKIQFN